MPVTQTSLAALSHQGMACCLLHRQGAVSTPLFRTPSEQSRNLRYRLIPWVVGLGSCPRPEPGQIAILGGCERLTDKDAV